MSTELRAGAETNEGEKKEVTIESPVYPKDAKDPNSLGVKLEDASLLKSKEVLNPESACEIVYRDLTYTITKIEKKEGKKAVNEKAILKNISGIFRPGRFTAIMGASGAGKTSFLNVIGKVAVIFLSDLPKAGEAKLGEVSGDILVNGEAVNGSEMKRISGFVFQDDVILATMTVREAIMMSAILRLPQEIPMKEKEERVDAIIRDMGLNKCADTIIGDAHIKGVSGGERKRCAIAMELVTNPKVLFLDEPTSGLDTFTAFSVIHTLRDLAHSRGQTYIATIHQPSSQLFRLFDDLLLLSEGRVMYYGKTLDAVPYFKSHGFPCPTRSNPADYFFYHILNNQDGATMPTADRSSTEQVAVIDETNQERIARMLDVWEKSPENEKLRARIAKPNTKGIPRDTIKYQSGFLNQANYLFNRESKFAFRDPLVLRSRFVQTVFLSLIVGLLYLRNADIEKSQGQNTIGVLFFLAVTNVMMSSQAHLTSFGKQKAVFAREYGAGYYEAKADKYFILVIIAILASISGFSLGDSSSSQIDRDSFLVGCLSIPTKWLPIKYAYEAAIRNQARDSKTGEELLEDLG
ncbi:ATP-binding cassette sub- G member 1 [Phlyctochytrium bullatum]|nr:ATP-binding cassette sub- G member 1 [Phlyctochytrium bullatum]